MPPPSSSRRRRPVAAVAPPLLLLLLSTLLILTTPHPASAYPAYFLAKNSACGAQPTKALGKHRAPVADPQTAFAVQGPSGRETRLCPGGVYTVTASFPDARNALLSASAGSFDDSGCRVLTSSRVRSVRGTFRVPCGAQDGSKISLRVTSATGQTSAFLQAGVTLPVVGGCAMSTCRGAPPPASRSGR